MMDFDPTQQRIVALRERAWTLIHAGHVVRGLNALGRVNCIALKHAPRRREVTR